MIKFPLVYIIVFIVVTCVDSNEGASGKYDAVEGLGGDADQVGILPSHVFRMMGTHGAGSNLFLKEGF